MKCTACTGILNYAKLMLSPQQADVGNDDKVGKKQKEVEEAIMCPVTCSHPSKKKKALSSAAFRLEVRAVADKL